MARYEFAGFTLDIERRLLTDQLGGKVVLPPRVLDILNHMVSRRGSLVRRQDLMQAVWGNTVVAENTVDQGVSILRRAFKRYACSDIVVTESGRGFRFVAEVMIPTDPASIVQPDVCSGSADKIKQSVDADTERLLEEAQALMVRPSSSNLRGALSLLDTVLERQPQRAAALADRAALRILFRLFDVPMEDALVRAESEARQALAHDPTLARAYATLAHVHMTRCEWLDAATHLDTACSFGELQDFAVAHGLLWQSVGHRGKVRMQNEEMHRALPHSPLATLGRAGSMLEDGVDAEAERYLEATLSLGWPLAQRPLPDLRFLIALRKRNFEAAALAAKDILDNPLREAGGERVVALMCEALKSTRSRGTAVSALRAFIKRTQGGVLGHRNEKTVLSWLVLLGALDDAFGLHCAILAPDRKGGPNGGPWGFLWGPEMRPFRRDPRFEDIADRMNLVSFWTVHGPPDGYLLTRSGHLLETGSNLSAAPSIV